MYVARITMSIHNLIHHYTFQIMELSITFNPGANAVVCSSADFMYCGRTGTPQPPPPPVEITVDFGDGSGQAVWHEDAPTNIFQHRFAAPGTYYVAVKSEYQCS